MDKSTRLIFDDPKGDEPASASERELEWWREVMEPREGDRELNLIVQSRLHLEDETRGLPVNELEDWEMLKLPIQEES